MLVYGDTARPRVTAAMLAKLEASLSDLAAMPPGLTRHAALVGCFIEAAALAQGIADAGFWARGHDAPCVIDDAAMALVMRLAAAVRLSWDSGFADMPALGGGLAIACAQNPLAQWGSGQGEGDTQGRASPREMPPSTPAWPPHPTLSPGGEEGFAARCDLPALNREKGPGLSGEALPVRIEPKLAEGFAFYALYPEATLTAAARSGLGPDTLVIGLRSIGLPLAALVATALGAAPPTTLRPVGHPFDRRLALSDATHAALLSATGAIAIVDEGPGLSGSSVGAVADLLEDAGIAPDRLQVFPSHAGPPGAAASPRHRARWNRLRRHVQDCEATVLDPPRPRHRLDHWVAELVGPVRARQDLSGGAWRALCGPAPANPGQERRKYLFEAADGRRWLAKFNGLGDEGARKTAMAATLAAAGFIPAVAGHRHGFLVQAWQQHDPSPGHAATLLPRVAGYLRFRAARFPGGPGAGAETLWEMACHNTAEGLGETAAEALRQTRPDLAAIDARRRPCAIDGRMHAWEWLRRPDGRLLKADAVDHHAAHDLVGCQDIAWDVAGAAVELGIDRAALAAALGVDDALLGFHRICYLAFQLGLWTMAGQTGTASRYAAMLRDEL